MSVLGVILLTMLYFLYKGKPGAKKSGPKDAPLEEVVIPERKRLNAPIPAPAVISPPLPASTEPLVIGLRGPSSAASQPQAGEPISLASKRALQGGAVLTNEQPTENSANPSSASENLSPEQKALLEADAIIRRRTREGGSVVDFLGGVPKPQSSNPQQTNGMGQRVDGAGAGAVAGSGSGAAGQGMANPAAQFASLMPQMQGLGGNAASQSTGENSAVSFPVRPARQIPLSADSYITQGTNIRCVMETRLISTLDSATLCNVAENIYAANATKILIPKGSKILGEYKEGKGTDRVSVIWNRLITPNGVDISLSASIGTDSLGSAGIPGKINSNWGEKLGAALLISLGSDIFKYGVITRGPKITKNVIDTNTGRVTTIEEPFESATVDTLSKLPEKILAKSLARPDTITVNQGTLINIITSRDMDFTSVN